MNLDRPTRRALLGAAALAPLLGLRAAYARDAPIEITWRDLIPENLRDKVLDLPSMGVREHGAMSFLPGSEPEPQVTREYDGKTIRMPGFVVPLDYGSEGVTSFLLVPYVGACIHVPPPPANQIVFVTTEEPYRDAGLFDAVWVTGMFGAASTSTQLADVGYSLSADRIEPYE